jgi:hypothetical protein
MRKIGASPFSLPWAKSKTLTSKFSGAKRAGVVAEAVQHLHGKHETLSSKPSTPTHKKEKAISLCLHIIRVARG